MIEAAGRMFNGSFAKAETFARIYGLYLAPVVDSIVVDQTNPTVLTVMIISDVPGPSSIQWALTGTANLSPGQPTSGTLSFLGVAPPSMQSLTVSVAPKTAGSPDTSLEIAISNPVGGIIIGATTEIVTVKAAAIGSPLRLTNDTFYVTLNSTDNVLNVLANDLPTTGKVITNVQNPATGSLRINSDGQTLVYDAGAIENSENLIYEVTHPASGTTATATLTLVTEAALLATADFFNVDTNTTSFLDVMANDQPWSNIEIISCTGPLVGSISVNAGTTLKYVAPTAAGNAAGTYTIRHKRTLATTSSAYAITVNKTTVPPSPTTGVPKRQPIKSKFLARQIRTVGFEEPGSTSYMPGGRPGLAAACLDANPGDLILLANGDYTGAAITLSRAGTVTSPVYFRPRVHQMASIQLRIIQAAAHQWFSGFKLDYQRTLGDADDSTYDDDDAQFLVRAAGLQVTNCLTTCPQISTHNLVKYNVGDHCFSYNTGKMDLPAKTKPSCGWVCWIGAAGIKPPNFQIAYNQISCPVTYTGPETPITGRSFLNYEPSKPTNVAAYNDKFKIHHNHISGPGWKYCIYLKHQGDVHYNYLQSGNMAYRCGAQDDKTYDKYGSIIGNYFDSGCINMILNGCGLLIQGNKCADGAFSNVWFYSGAKKKPTILVPESGPYYMATSYSTWVDNDFPSVPIEVGHCHDSHIESDSWGGYAQNIRFYWGAGSHATPTKGHASCSFTTAAGLGPYTTKITPVVPAELKSITGCDPLGTDVDVEVGGPGPGPDPDPDPTWPTPPTSTWWKLPNRSGRLWPSGPGNWSDAQTELALEEGDVALIDAIMGSNTTSTPDDRPNYQKFYENWNGIIGGAYASSGVGTVDDTLTQMDLTSGNGYGLGDAMEYLPVNSLLYPQGCAWIVWVCALFPHSYSTWSDTEQAWLLPESSPIWDEFIAGTHDNHMRQFGRNLVRTFEATGHPLKRLILNPHREHNKGETSFKVYPSTRAKYKSAMERAFDKIRLGAEDIRVGAGSEFHILHRVAYRGNIGPLSSYCPNNADCVGMSWHPGNNATTIAELNSLVAGTGPDPDGIGLYGIGTDLINLAASLSPATNGVPIVFPEWSPKYEPNDHTPIADEVVQHFRNYLLTIVDRLVCDCVYAKNIREELAYKGLDAAGIKNWKDMVPLRKTLWGGNKTTTVPGGGDDLPPVTTNNVLIDVDVANNLENTYRVVAGDTTIWVAPGVINRASGSWNLNRDFADGKPVVIRPVGDVWGGLDFRQRVTISGNNNILSGVGFTNLGLSLLGGECMRVQGRNSRITRCFVRHNTAVDAACIGIVLGGPGDAGVTGLRVDHCEVSIKRGAGGGTSNCMGIRLANTADLPNAPLINYNWIHDCNGLTDTEATAANGYEAIQLGEGNASAHRDVQAVVEYNLIERCSNESEALSVKSSSNVIRYNVLRNCGRGGASQRVGEDGRWTGNRSESSAGFIVWAAGHTYVGNVVTGGNDFSLGAGNSTVAEYNAASTIDSTNNRPAAEYCNFYHNDGPMNIGAGDAPFTSDVHHINVYDHTGTVTVIAANASNIDQSGSSPVGTPGTPTLLGGTAAGVGVNVGMFGSSGGSATTMTWDGETMTWDGADMTHA